MTPTDTRAEGEAVAVVCGLHRACQTAANDDLSKPQTEKRRRHIARIDAMYAAIDLIATLSAQLAEAQRQRDDYAAMWESNAMATAAAANRVLTAEERLAEDVAAYRETVAILEAASSRQLAETRKITEAMVEAGARVIAECTRTGIIEAPKLDWPCWMGTSRAIIEAALSPRDADAAAMRTTKS